MNFENHAGRATKKKRYLKTLQSFKEKGTHGHIL